LAVIIILLVAQNLHTRILISCLEVEILARNLPPTLSFIAENSSLLFVEQSNQLIEHVSSRSGGLGIFSRTKNTHLPGYHKIKKSRGADSIDTNAHP